MFYIVKDPNVCEKLFSKAWRTFDGHFILNFTGCLEFKENLTNFFMNDLNYTVRAFTRMKQFVLVPVAICCLRGGGGGGVY